MRMPDGSLMPVASLDEPLIDEARRTREKGNPVAGMIAKLQMSGPIPGLPGRMQAEVTIGDQTYIAGTLKFEIDPSLAPIPATNVLPPPS